MSDFPRHSVETAPEDAKDRLAAATAAFGFTPGLYQVMADAPQLLEIYQRTHEAFQSTSFSNAEMTVVWQSINVEHECHYCVPAHTGLAHMMKVDPVLTEALRNEAPLGDAKLEALRSFTLKMVRGRGHVSEADLAEFHAAGYGTRQVLEVILGISQKVLSNYTNHVARTEVDAPFTDFAWERSGKDTKAA